MSLMSLNESEKGGYKEIAFGLEGNEVFGKMKFESGVHRVQPFQQLRVRDEFTLLQLPWPYCQRLKK